MRRAIDSDVIGSHYVIVAYRLVPANAAADRFHMQRTELTSSGFAPVFFSKFEFDSGDLRFWSGIGNKTFNGETYTGSGDLLAITPADETQQLKATNANFTLSGIPSSIISVALAEPFQGRFVNLWFAVLDSNENIVADPFLQFKGRMDVMAIQDQGDTATITVSAESVLVDLERPKEKRYTAEDQKLDNPTDEFFNFVPALAEKEITLGRTT